MREFAKSFYNSAAWKKCRAGYIKSVYGLCERCSKPGYIVHHKIVLTPKNMNDPYVTLAWKNLEYLCQDCHNKEHMAKPSVNNGLEFDENGNLIELLAPPFKQLG